jgi:hypothetical protein
VFLVLLAPLDRGFMCGQKTSSFEPLLITEASFYRNCGLLSSPN